jgi:O-antigen ligase
LDPRRRWADLGQISIAARAAAIGVALVLGVTAALHPLLAAAGVIGIALAGVVLANITAGLLVFVVVAFVESVPAVGGGPSTAKLFGLFLVISWAGAIAFGRRSERASRDLVSLAPALVWSMGLFLAWVFFSLLWAEDVAVAEESFSRFALNFALFPIVFTALREQRHVIFLYAAFVVGALITASAGVFAQQGTDYAGERLAGAGLHPNTLGALAATAAVMAAVLACARGLSVPARVAALVAAFLCAISLVMTETRGAAVGLAAAMVAAPLVAGRRRRLAASGAVILAALLLVLWLATFAPPSAVARFTDLGSSGSGRSDLWTIGLRMVEDKPMTGVGAGNFPVSSIHYLIEPGTIVRDELVVDVPKQTHNIYLQVLSELGLVGLTLFLAIIVLCLSSSLRAARAFRRERAHTLETLARGLALAMIALLVASAFTTEVYSKQLYILLATGPALLGIARHRQADATSSARPLI